MFEQLVAELSLRQILISILIFGVFVGLTWLFHFFLRKVVRRLAQKTRTHLDDAILMALEKPVLIMICIGGLYLALLTLPLESLFRNSLTMWVTIVSGLLGIYILGDFLYTLNRWYRTDVLKDRGTGLTGFLVRLFQIIIIATTILFAVLFILSRLGINIAPVTGWIGAHGWRIGLIILLSMLIIFAASYYLPKLLVISIVRRPGELEEDIIKRANTLSRVLVNATQVFVILIAAFMVLSELQIDIAPVLASAGVIGIAIGFGAQSLIKDLISGLFIVMENQYHVGDVVRIADISGLVEDMNLRRTTLRDLDGTLHIVPNGEIRVASNFAKEWSRVNLNVSVAYGENLDRVIAVINRVGKGLAEDPAWAPMILKPPQVLRVDNLGDSGIDIKILGDTKPIKQWDVMGELRKRLKDVFDKEGIEIPWPHTKVYFGNPPSSNLNQEQRQKRT